MVLLEKDNRKEGVWLPCVSWFVGGFPLDFTAYD